MATIHPLFTEERSFYKATHLIRITHADLTETTTATAQTITFPVVAKQAVSVQQAILREAFEDTTDTANNSTTVIAGDDGSTSRFLASMQVNANGTPVWAKGGALTNATAYTYTADNTVDITFSAPPVAKTLAAFNKGIIDIYVNILDARQPA